MDLNEELPIHTIPCSKKTRGVNLAAIMEIHASHGDKESLFRYAPALYEPSQQEASIPDHSRRERDTYRSTGMSLTAK